MKTKNPIILLALQIDPCSPKTLLTGQTHEVNELTTGYSELGVVWSSFKTLSFFFDGKKKSLKCFFVQQITKGMFVFI